MAIPKKVAERLKSGLRRYQPIIKAQHARDVSEADTVTLVKDVLSDVFGYDKYAELTSEHMIRGTYCDLAIHLDGKLALLIEVKAIGSNMVERHVKQAIDYAANQGTDWVILTNGIKWVLFHVLFKKPIEKEEVLTLDFLDASARSSSDLERLYLFTREGVVKDAQSEFRERQGAANRFMLSALLLGSDPVVSAIRREVRRVSGVLIDKEAIQTVLRDQVIKRDALEGDQATDAKRLLSRKTAKRASAKRARSKESQQEEPA